MNSPADTQAVLKSLIVYAVGAGLAIFLGYMLTNPMTVSTFGFVGILAVALALPLLLRWHYPVLLLCWNMTAVLFFLKGEPSLWLAVVVLSLAISVMERTLNSRMQFLHAPQIAWPLLALIVVVLVTAKLTGGFGLHAFGSEVYGGKKYVFLLIGIVSYFALTAKKIPPQRAKLYTAFFFLGGVTFIFGDLWSVMPSSLQFLLWFFPPNFIQNVEMGTTRLPGICFGSEAVIFCLLAIYGIRGIFMSGKLWRLAIFLLCFVMVFLGGYRSALFAVGLTFVILFFLEGLHRTKLMPVFMLAGLLAAGLIIPFARHLPFTFQRTLAFLPLDLDPEAKMAAQGSTDWRLQMWSDLLPQVPKHLLLGKGFTISPEDYDTEMGYNPAIKGIDPGTQGLALAGDYHSGPLSLILPFGIWGVIAFLWFLFGSARVLLANYRYGDPALKIINTYLLAAFIVETIVFFFIFGGLSSDIAKFVGYVGFSIALNGGVRHPAPRPVAQAVKTMDAENFLRPAFQR